MKKTSALLCSLCDSPADHSVTSIAQCKLACQHSFCSTCLNNTCHMYSEQKKQVTSLCCPVPKCHAKVNLTELLKLLKPANSCKRCHHDVPYTCGQCLIEEIEEVAKSNFYSKQLKFEQLIQIEDQQELLNNVQQHELICPICKEFNQLPVIICQVGHEICKDCYYNIRGFPDINQVCPMCKSELLPLPPNSLRANTIIRNLNISCPKCKQNIKYPEFIQNHYRNCCETKIVCQGCQEAVELQFYDIHASNYCQYTQCPFKCDKKLDHNTNFIMEHLLQSMKQSDVAHTFMLRMHVVEKFLFSGSFGMCQQCDSQFAWQMDIRGVSETFCFKCFRFT